MPDSALSAPPIDVLVLSPHYDDAVLSCGGALHRWSATGVRACVVTVCGGAPVDDTLSPYAASLHARWERSAAAKAGGDRPETDGSDHSLTTTESMVHAARRMVHAARRTVAMRRAEDAAALRRLSTPRVVLEVPDAIYRRAPDAVGWLYEGDDAIFGPLSASEAPLVSSLRRRLASLPGLVEATRILTPLTVGGHVDHQLVRLAAEAAWPPKRIVYYEDYPYARSSSSLESCLADGTWSASLTPLGPDDLAAKLEAVACYASQLSTFWDGPEHVAREITSFARSRSATSRPAERWWRRG